MDKIQLNIISKASSLNYGVLAVAAQINLFKPNTVEIQLSDTTQLNGTATVLVTYQEETYNTANSVVRLLARLHPDTGLYAKDATGSTLVDKWLDFANSKLLTTEFKSLDIAFKELNNHLTLRSFIVGYSVTIADFMIWGYLRASPIFARIIKTKRDTLGPYLTRWYDYMLLLDASAFALRSVQNQVKTKGTDQGKFDIGLTDANMGKVCTRFPPEPSGYLHIGHIKAALMNQYFAEKYKGKLIIRFDDTNPTKEKAEFEESFVKDLAELGIDTSIISHTSDYFDILYKMALQLVKDGKAYCDDTDPIQMRQQRNNRLPSHCRNHSIDENLRRFDEMTKGSIEGISNCLRAKIAYDSPNGALRDPVIYRCSLTPHHRTDRQWKIYPTYDLACPVVDSLEGITHALRTNEYRDRNAQYDWMLNALGLRSVTIYDFSRINFVYTVLSKRKLKWFVENKLVDGWDDPRFPTYRGIRRRGLTIQAMKEYILMQGASQNTVLLEWDKLWALNRKIIDPIAPRHVAIYKKGAVECFVNNAKTEIIERYVHKKNPQLGKKKTRYSPTIYLDKSDTDTLTRGDKIVLMDWGSAIVCKVSKNNDKLHIDLELDDDQDFKKIDKKLTWLSKDNDVINIVLVDYDYLLSKKKPEDDDKIQDIVKRCSVCKTPALADGNIRELKKGAIIQFERRGYYILDKLATDAEPAHFIRIPDGKAAKR